MLRPTRPAAEYDSSTVLGYTWAAVFDDQRQPAGVLQSVDGQLLRLAEARHQPGLRLLHAVDQDPEQHAPLPVRHGVDSHVNLEAAELLELTQWQEAPAFEAASREETTKQRLAEECADIFLYLLLICERTGINLSDAASAKIQQNEQKYPAEKSRGSATKYDQL